MKTSRKTLLALIGAMAMGAAMAAPSVEIVSVQQQYPWTNTVDIVYNVAGVASDTNGYFVAFTPTTKEGTPIEDINGETSIQVALSCTTNGAVAQWFPQTNQQYTACKMTPAVYRGGSSGGNDYMIVDLENWTVSYEPMATQEASNEKYNTEEYKTKKMVFRRIPAGTYMIGDSQNFASSNPSHEATTAKDYYITIFMVTAAQYDRIVNGGTSSATTPKVYISWNTIRGSALVQARPSTGIMAILNRNLESKGVTGFDLPTESMWEIAARAGLTTPWISPTYDAIGNYAWYSANQGSGTRPVGLKLPNAWGLYDVTGNAWEWCRDAWNSAALDTIQPDPLVPVAGSSSLRPRRGSCSNNSNENLCFSTRGGSSAGNSSSWGYSFRIAVIVE